MKPGWIRLSLHPTMTNDELFYILNAIRQTIENAEEWKKDYRYDNQTNEFHHFLFPEKKCDDFARWFKLI